MAWRGLGMKSPENGGNTLKGNEHVHWAKNEAKWLKNGQKWHVGLRTECYIAHERQKKNGLMGTRNEIGENDGALWKGMYTCIGLKVWLNGLKWENMTRLAENCVIAHAWLKDGSTGNRNAISRELQKCFKKARAYALEPKGGYMTIGRAKTRP
jgi:hypothetical protein